METHIRNARVLTPDGALAKTGVAVADGRIIAIGDGERDRPPAGARVIEADGLLDLPRVVATLVAGRAVFAGREPR